MKRFLIVLVVISAAVTIVRLVSPSAMPNIRKYAVRGIDVSHHQGAIDWSRLKSENVSFVYIKATEGGDLQDRRFVQNWQGASRIGLATGAYHFFTFCRPGNEQAANLMKVLKKVTGPMLPPAIDVEFTGNCTRWKNITTVRKELKTMIRDLTSKLQTKILLYVTQDSYQRIIKGHFNANMLWIRNTTTEPKVSWTIWQYSDKSRISGIQGNVDGNVFSGSVQKLRELVHSAPFRQ